MKKFYISTAIDYPSEKPHLGHALEKVQADVLARYKRLQGFDVHFSTGLDEHGQKIQRYAQKANKKPQEFVDETSKYFRDLCKVLNISNDDFIRTTEKRHIKVVQELIKKIYKKGGIYKGKYKGLYCVDCESFYLPKDLVDNKCPVHRKALETIEEETYFFRMSKYQRQLLKYIQENKNFVIPESRRSEILNRLKEPLRDLSISRKTVEWGVPLPFDKKLTLSVWVDALINYLTTISYPNDKFRKFWPADVHVIGKDILWHHSVIWGSLLLSLGLPLPKKIFAHGFITVDGQKMSKSLGNVIDPFELVKKYGTDAVRYFLLREIPSTEDGDFTYEKFEQRYNSDLASGIGNLVARVLTMAEKYCDSKVPKIDKNPDSHALRVDEKIYNWKKAWQDLDKYLNNYQFNEALSSIWKFISEADKYIEKNKPWQLAKEGKKEELNWVLYGLLDALHQLAWQVYIFIPDTALEIAKSLKIEKLLGKNPNYKDSWTNIKSGTRIKKEKLLFPKI